MLVTFDAILAPDELSAVRALLTQAPWASGLSAGPQALLAKRNQQLPEDFGPLPDLRRLVMRALNRSPLLL